MDKTIKISGQSLSIFGCRSKERMKPFMASGSCCMIPDPGWVE